MRGVRRLLIGIAVSAAAVCLLCPLGLANGGDDAAPEPRQIRLHGVVTRPDGKPAARCLVRVGVHSTPSSGLEVTTGPDGRYSTSVSAAGPAVIDAWVDDVGQSKLLTAAPPEGRDSVALDIPLRSIPFMSGHVFLPDRAPAADLTVEASGALWRDCSSLSDMAGAGGTAGSGMLTLQTDSRGRCRRSPLPRSAFRSGWGDGAEYHIYLISPVGWMGPVSIEMDLDAPEIRQDIHLQTGDRVEGVVVGYPGGRPLPGVGVEAAVSVGYVLGAPCKVGEAMSDDDGQFEIPVVLPPGEYDLGGRAKGWLLVSVEEEERVDTGVGSSIRTRIAMARPLRIEGTIYGPNGAPLRNARIELRDQEVIPDPEGGPPRNAGITTFQLSTDGEGRYAYEYHPRFTRGAPPRMPRYLRVGPLPLGAATCEPVLLDVFEERPAKLDFHFRAAGRAP
jgi:hypothetical protein